MVPLLNPLQSRLFADRTHNRILYPIEKRILGGTHGSSSVNHRNSTEQTRVVSSVLYHFSIISPISLLFSLSITFIYSLSSIKRAKVENLYDPGSPCSSSPFADWNDLKALSLYILWSPLTSNAELQPSPIYQPPRPPAALTL
ncbi:hypothetical protein N7516_005014 [Penicillium verrucosum]|uniref:uncharacterized protein n=1 Tax=Penicillium verrucosum TaxID=60171 RepID=UPI002545148C|nr:uncharacterized protein N7516_005014 [Penicillium verrucosum]KAJ5944846.1 hypothetical protein N7516_005014 [Penicillium verrucosum]